MTGERVLLLTESSKWGDLACGLITASGAGVEHIPWSWGEERTGFDAVLRAWSGNYIVCFKADCIVPKPTLSGATIAINFHPGPPWLRGVACPERAVRREDRVYGVTCHHMIEEVDAGKIVAVDTFGVSPGESVIDLREQVGLAMLTQLKRIWQDRRMLSKPGETRDPIWTSELLSIREARSEGLL